MPVTVTTETYGWVITKDHINTDADDNNRVGYGQGLKEISETQASHDRIIGRTIFMRSNLAEPQIPEERRVRFRAYDDDMELYYEGIIDIDWIFYESADEDDEIDDPAYELDRFCMEDAGAVHVLYSAKDIGKHEKYAAFAERHPRMKDPKLHDWLPLYG